MARHETPYAVTSGTERRGRWSLAGVFWLDLAIVILLIVLLNVVMLGYVYVRALQAGSLGSGSPAGAQAPTEAMARQLLGNNGLLLFLLMQSLILLAVPIVRVRVIRREPLATLGLQLHRPLRLIAIGLGLGVLMLIANIALTALFRSIDVQQNQAAMYPLTRGDYVGQALFFALAAIVVPVAEEMLFRGYAFNAFRQTYGQRRWGVAAAYVVSALLFMLSHSLSATEGLLGLLVPIFLIGLLLAWGVHRTGSLLPSVIAHAMNNSMALLGLLLCVNMPGIPGCSDL